MQCERCNDECGHDADVCEKCSDEVCSDCWDEKAALCVDCAEEARAQEAAGAAR